MSDTFSQIQYRFASRMTKMKSSAVREILKVTERPDIISFAGGLPAPELFPIDAIAQAHADIFQDQGMAALQYSTTEGWRPLREWIAERMKMRDVDAHSDRIMITNGSQQGIDLVAKVLLEAGDQVVVEDPCYLAALQSFSGFEASFIGIESDDEGMRIDQLERALQEARPKLIYLVADFQNPKGTTLSIERRKQLIELAYLHQVPILEDDPYGELRFRGVRPPLLAALDEQELVIYISTFSKTLSPGMRIGWISAPEEIYQTLVIAKQAADLHTSTVEQRAAARTLETFDFERHIARLCAVYGERCNVMLNALNTHFPPGTRWTIPEGGLFLWVELPEHISGDELLEDALESNVAFVPGSPFFVKDVRHNFLRLNFSNRPPEIIEQGIGLIAEVLKRRMQ
jgi:2-aminoadipate transaminase